MPRSQVRSDHAGRLLLSLRVLRQRSGPQHRRAAARRIGPLPRAAPGVPRAAARAAGAAPSAGATAGLGRADKDRGSPSRRTHRLGPLLRRAVPDDRRRLGSAPPKTLPSERSGNASCSRTISWTGTTRSCPRSGSQSWASRSSGASCRNSEPRIRSSARRASSASARLPGEPSCASAASGTARASRWSLGLPLSCPACGPRAVPRGSTSPRGSWPRRIRSLPAWPSTACGRSSSAAAWCAHRRTSAPRESRLRIPGCWTGSPANSALGNGASSACTG